jgi:hypothetical protein
MKDEKQAKKSTLSNEQSKPEADNEKRNSQQQEVDEQEDEDEETGLPDVDFKRFLGCGG